MKDICYLVLSKKGVVKMTKTMPPTKPDEIKFKLFIELDDHHFEDTALEIPLKVPLTFKEKLKQFEFELKELKEID